MPATLIPTSASSQLYRDAERRFWSSWANSKTAKPVVVNVFYVNHQGHQVWFNYDDYRKKHGNEQYMWHGTTRACTIGDDNTQVNACNLHNCGVCHILRATLDPKRAVFSKPAVSRWWPDVTANLAIGAVGQARHQRAL